MRTTFVEGVTLNEAPISGDLALHFGATPTEQDFCPVCFDRHGRSTCTWVTKTREWKQENLLRKLRREVQATEKAKEAKARKVKALAKAHRNAIRASRSLNPEVPKNTIWVKGALYTKRDTFRPNATHAELARQNYQLWLLGTRSFDFTPGEADFSEEEQFFAEIEQSHITSAKALVKQAVNKALKEEGVPMTPAQLKRAKKKANAGGRRPNTSKPKVTKKEVVTEPKHDRVKVEEARTIVLSMRRTRKEQAKMIWKMYDFQRFIANSEPDIQVTLDMGYHNVPIIVPSDWVIPGLAAVLMGA